MKDKTGNKEEVREEKQHEMVAVQILGIVRLFSKYLLSAKNFCFLLISTIPFQQRIFLKKIPNTQ